MEETSNPAIGVIVLAAGASRRMKRPKQLLSFQNKTLLRRAAEAAAGSRCRPAVVVLGANFEAARAEIKDLPVNICFNENWNAGLSSSIKTGLTELLRLNEGVSAVLITLGDQPFVTAEKLNLFAAEFMNTEKQVVAAEYGEGPGVPALFARELFDELFALEGDRGARKVIERHIDRLARIALPEAAFDVDTPEDFEELCGRDDPAKD